MNPLQNENGPKMKRKNTDQAESVDMARIQRKNPTKNGVLVLDRKRHAANPQIQSTIKLERSVAKTNWNSIFLSSNNQNEPSGLGKSFISRYSVNFLYYKSDFVTCQGIEVMCKHIWHFSLSLRNVCLYGKNNTRRTVAMAQTNYQ